MEERSILQSIEKQTVSNLQFGSVENLKELIRAYCDFLGEHIVIDNLDNISRCFVNVDKTAKLPIPIENNFDDDDIIFYRQYFSKHYIYYTADETKDKQTVFKGVVPVVVMYVFCGHYDENDKKLIPAYKKYILTLNNDVANCLKIPEGVPGDSVEKIYATDKKDSTDIEQAIWFLKKYSDIKTFQDFEKKLKALKEKGMDAQNFINLHLNVDDLESKKNKFNNWLMKHKPLFDKEGSYYSTVPCSVEEFKDLFSDYQSYLNEKNNNLKYCVHDIDTCLVPIENVNEMFVKSKNFIKSYIVYENINDRVLFYPIVLGVKEGDHYAVVPYYNEYIKDECPFLAYADIFAANMSIETTSDIVNFIEKFSRKRNELDNNIGVDKEWKIKELFGDKFLYTRNTDFSQIDEIENKKNSIEFGKCVRKDGGINERKKKLGVYCDPEKEEQAEKSRIKKVHNDFNKKLKDLQVYYNNALPDIK